MADYENVHVHAVYQAIAPHFSLTRHTPWPLVRAFLLSLPPGSLGLDVGCGNGKYMSVNPLVHILGSDRSPALCTIAATNTGTGTGSRMTTTTTATTRRDVVVADSLALPYRAHCADFALCIAVIHHFSTPERRRQALRAILDTLKRGNGKTSNGKEGEGTGKWEHVSSDSKRGASAAAAEEGREEEGERKGEQSKLEQDQKSHTHLQQADSKEPQHQPMHHRNSSSSGGPGRALIYVWALEQETSRRGWRGGDQQDTLVPWVMKKKGRQEETYQRYYHLYKEGELEEDVLAVGGRVLESGYEKDNWWVICCDEEQDDDGDGDGDGAG